MAVEVVPELRFLWPRIGTVAFAGRCALPVGGSRLLRCQGRTLRSAALCVYKHALQGVVRGKQLTVESSPWRHSEADAFELPGASHLSAPLRTVGDLARYLDSLADKPWRAVLDPSLVTEGRSDEDAMIQWREQEGERLRDVMKPDDDDLARNRLGTEVRL